MQDFVHQQYVMILGACLDLCKSAWGLDLGFYRALRALRSYGL